MATAHVDAPPVGRHRRPVPTRGGGLIAAARLQAGLSQAELAARARTSQSSISDYEQGRKAPSLSTLERLVAAAGFDLRIGLAPIDDHDESLERWTDTLPKASRERFADEQAKRARAPS